MRHAGSGRHRSSGRHPGVVANGGQSDVRCPFAGLALSRYGGMSSSSYRSGGMGNSDYDSGYGGGAEVGEGAGSAGGTATTMTATGPARGHRQEGERVTGLRLQRGQAGGAVQPAGGGRGGGHRPRRARGEGYEGGAGSTSRRGTATLGAPPCRMTMTLSPGA